MINRVKLCGVVLKIANPQGAAGAFDKPKLLHAAPHFMNFGKELSIATRGDGANGERPRVFDISAFKSADLWLLLLFQFSLVSILEPTNNQEASSSCMVDNRTNKTLAVNSILSVTQLQIDRTKLALALAANANFTIVNQFWQLEY